ncbi:MAG: hypothetical protein ACYTFY_11485 [Planctomycetota bacterium]|jgi:hypothetical protein
MKNIIIIVALLTLFMTGCKSSKPDKGSQTPIGTSAKKKKKDKSSNKSKSKKTEDAANTAKNVVDGAEAAADTKTGGKVMGYANNKVKNIKPPKKPGIFSKIGKTMKKGLTGAGNLAKKGLKAIDIVSPIATVAGHAYEGDYHGATVAATDAAGGKVASVVGAIGGTATGGPVGGFVGGHVGQTAWDKTGGKALKNYAQEHSDRQTRERLMGNRPRRPSRPPQLRRNTGSRVTTPSGSHRSRAGHHH